MEDSQLLTAMPILRPGLVFVHIPKCAGTSIEVAAGFGEQYPSLGLQPTAAATDRSRLFGGGLEHLSIREILGAYGDLFDERPQSFAIVRDPVDRFVSHFVWRFYRFNDNPPPLEQLIPELRAFTGQVAAAAKQQRIFADPREGIVYDGAANSIHPNDIFRHLVPQCAFLFDRGELAVDAIYDMSSMAQLTQMLHEAYGFPQTLPKRMVGPASSDLRKHLPEDVEQLVRSMYEADEAFIRTAHV